MENGVPVALLPLLDAWKAPQVGLDEVIRWKKYLNKGPGARRQDSLQHSHSITVLGAMMLEQFRFFVPLNGELVLTALVVHDVGEGEIRKDTLFVDKTVEGDLEEYLAFRRRYEPLGYPVFNSLHRAFLLQFALKNPEIFPADARTVMASIAENFHAEALMFEAIEKWDYVLYALEQYHERGNEMILVQTLRNLVFSFDVLAKKLTGFGEVIWTREFSGWVKHFLSMHEGQWIEQKGEV